MEKNLKISFVIPAYNAETMLTDAVNSIFDGNFSEGDEVIIVNDASKDETSKSAHVLAEKYTPHVIIINNVENKGCPASRNIGITSARNELIFNLDADNILAPKSINTLRKALIEHNADVAAFGEYWYFKTNPKKITHKWICKTGVFTLADFLSGAINPGPGGNFLYKKSIWEKVGHYWEYGKGLHEAWGYTLKLLINDAKCIVVPDTFYFHRYSHQSLFMRENSKINEGIRVSNLFIKSAIALLSKKSREYIETTPNWFDRIDVQPLTLTDGSRGINGRVIHMTMRGKIRQMLKLVYAKIFQ